MGGVAAFVDVEHALDRLCPALWRERGGCTSPSPTRANRVEITEALIRSGAVDVVVVDSIAAWCPRRRSRRHGRRTWASGVYLNCAS